MKTNEIFDMLKQVATTSDFPQQKLAAALVRRGKIVSLGVNSTKTHPMQKKFGRNSKAIHLHAEIDCIKNALRENSVDDLSKMDLYITRIKKTKPNDSKYVYGLAKPCAGCMRAIAQFNIGRVFYTCDGEDLYYNKI